MRVPSREARPWAASFIMDPIAPIENAPLAAPSKNTLALSGHAGPTRPANVNAAIATAEATHPPTVHRRREPILRSGETCDTFAAIRPDIATNTMPSKTPLCCTPASLVDSPGVKPKTDPAKGSRINSCAL